MNNLNHQKILNSVFLFFLISFILFGRTFSGIEIFGFRLGEILIGVGIFISISLFFAQKLKNQILIFSPLSYKIHLLIVINFVFIAAMNQSSFLDLYITSFSSCIGSASKSALKASTLESGELPLIKTEIPLFSKSSS